MFLGKYKMLGLVQVEIKNLDKLIVQVNVNSDVGFLFFFLLSFLVMFGVGVGVGGYVGFLRYREFV